MAYNQGFSFASLDGQAHGDGSCRHVPTRPAPSTSLAALASVASILGASTGIYSSGMMELGPLSPYSNPQRGFAGGRRPPQPVTLPSLSELDLPTMTRLTKTPDMPRPANSAPERTASSSLSEEDRGVKRKLQGTGPLSDEAARRLRNKRCQQLFRDRRAKRINELEDEVKRQRTIHRQEDAKLKGRLSKLELQVEAVMAKFRLLEEQLEREKAARLRAEMDAQAYRPSEGRVEWRFGGVPAGSSYGSDERDYVPMDDTWVDEMDDNVSLAPRRKLALWMQAQ